MLTDLCSRIRALASVLTTRAHEAVLVAASVSRVCIALSELFTHAIAPCLRCGFRDVLFVIMSETISETCLRIACHLHFVMMLSIAISLVGESACHASE